MIEITLFEAVNRILAGEDIKVYGKYTGFFTYGKNGLHIWHNGLYHTIEEKELKKTRFFVRSSQKR